MNNSESHSTTISPLLITLFKGVIYREDNTTVWQQLRRHEGRIQDYFSLLGLQLTVQENEGFAFLRNTPEENRETELPRLIPRRRLSYPVSLTLVLLRRRLADHDAASGDLRMILDVEEVIEMMRTFLPHGSTEARIVDRMNSTLKKIADMGFIRFVDREERKLEIMRILAAFVDAEWMNEFDQRLQAYAEHAGADEAQTGKNHE